MLCGSSGTFEMWDRQFHRGQYLALSLETLGSIWGFWVLATGMEVARSLMNISPNVRFRNNQFDVP